MNEFAGYAATHEETMRLYGRSLPEDHRRRYAALEALKIGFGGWHRPAFGGAACVRS